MDLPSFDLAGSRLRNLPRVTPRGKREGLRFEVVAPGEIAPCCPVEGGSPTAGCTANRAGRGGFSVGGFDPAYLTLNPMALVRREGRSSGLPTSGPATTRESLSIDLMRCQPGHRAAPVMDFLFVELLLWGKQEVMPASTWGWPHVGLQTTTPRRLLAQTPVHLGAAVSSNFQGLRRYKGSSAQGGSPAPALYWPSGAARTLTHLVSLISRGPSARGKIGVGP